MRAALLAIALLGSGCTWQWHELQLEDAGLDGSVGADGALRDAGEPDAGPVEADAGPEMLCASGEPCADTGRCVRGAHDPGEVCCFADLCLPRLERPTGWAEPITTGGGWPFTRQDAVAGDDHWRDARIYPLTSVTTAGVAPSTADGSATFRVAWSNIGLMLFVAVDDDDVVTGPGPGTDGLDALEIVLDVQPTSPRAPDDVIDSDDETRVWLAVRDGAPNQADRSFEGRAWDNLEAYYVERADGFDFEVGFNWTNLAGVPPTGNEVVALDVRWHDRDSDGSEHVYSWSDCRRSVGDGLGLVVLSDPPTDPTPSRCEERCAANDLCVPTGYACERATPTVCAP